MNDEQIVAIIAAYFVVSYTRSNHSIPDQELAFQDAIRDARTLVRWARA